MFCEHCGRSLKENSRFCEECGKACTGDQLNQPVAAANAIEEEWSRETHWEYFWEYFIKGLIGLGIGAMLAIAMGTPSGMIYLGLTFAGVPFGWNLITRLAGGWRLYGIVAVVIYYSIKLLCSLLIGITVYPPLLFYHLMLSQKPKTTAQTICIVFFALSIIGSLLVVSSLIMR